MTMSLKNILEHFNMTEQEFLDMRDDQWEERTQPILEKFEKEEHKDFFTLEAIALTLDTQAARKKKLDDQLVMMVKQSYQPLPVIVPGTPANEAKLDEIDASKNPINTVVAQSGKEATFDYIISGKDKAEIQKNRQGLFDAYDKYMSPKRSQLSDEEKEKYKPETVTFKTFAELEKSDKLFGETKASYKDMKFPLEITILKFDNFAESKTFMESDSVKPYLTKPVPKPAAEKKEDEKADVDKTKKQDDATQAPVPTGPK